MQDLSVGETFISRVIRDGPIRVSRMYTIVWKPWEGWNISSISSLFFLTFYHKGLNEDGTKLLFVFTHLD